MNTNFSMISRYLAELQPELRIAMRSKCEPNWMRSSYTPDYSKIYYICEGEGKLTIGDYEIFPRPGQLVFAPARLMQSFSVTDTSNTYLMYWCHFVTNISCMRLFQQFKLPYCITVDDTTGVIKLFENLAEEYKSGNGPTHSIRIKTALLELISCFIDQAARVQTQETAPLMNDKLAAVLSYIDANLIKDIKINELADIVHHHPNYFIRYFKSHLGVTPMVYLYERRLEQAKQLILSSNIPIGEVANVTGFHDIFHLSKNFKKRLGITPTEFRSLYGMQVQAGGRTLPTTMKEQQVD